MKVSSQLPGRRLSQRAYLAAGLMLCVAYLLLPRSDAAELLYLVISVSMPVVAWASMVGVPAARRHPWVILVSGFTMVAVAEALYFGAVTIAAREAWATRIDVVFLAAYVVQLAGVLALIRDRATSRSRADWLDAASIGVAAFIVVWSTVRSVIVDRADGDSFELAIRVAEPILGVALLVMSVRLLVGERRPHPTFVMLAIGYLLQTLTDGVANLADGYSVGGAVDTMWAVAYVVLGAACTHPSRLIGPPRAPTAQVRTEIRQVLAIQGAVVLTLIGVIGANIIDRVPSSTVTVWVIGGLAMLLLNRLRVHGLLKSVGTATLTEHQRTLSALVDQSNEVIGRADPDGTIRFVSAAVEDLTGYPPAWWHGRSFVEAVRSTVDGGAAHLLERIAALAPGESLVHEGTLTSRVGGNSATVRVTVVNHLDTPEIDGWILAIRDITDETRLTEELRHQALHDSLTGLPNRVLLADRIEHAIERGSRHPGLRLSLLLVDLDDFKSVNDSMGHQLGDDLLRALSERLTQAVRPGDTVARLGGDEFAVLLEGTDETDALAIAARVNAAVALPVPLDGAVLAVRASIGVVSGTGVGTSANDLLRSADIAMYQAKRDGKGRVTTFRNYMHDVAREQMDLRVDLAAALGHGELAVVYQPIVETSAGRLCGLEALLRWHHPTRGTVPPMQFIPVAEQAGLINEIGEWVLRTACAEAARWGGDDGPYISVNVSAVQLRAADFADTVAKVLADTRLVPSRLLLEITESMLIDDETRCRRTLTELRSLGVRVAIDDFGTGYSSLAYLRELAVDVVKIDRAFVHDLAVNADHRALTSTMLALAEGLSMTAIAEGVETESEHAELKRLGCTFAQGYLYAAPAAIEHLGHWLGSVQRVDAAPPLDSEQGAPPEPRDDTALMPHT
jgi:diguanylate cyclase (GGDEF)-like protein/PAS domain S-box-containing protein